MSGTILQAVLDTMSRDEKSLLLYFETCAVDKQGKVDSTRMNREDHDIASAWNGRDFVLFQRICSSDVTNGKNECVHLSGKAWELVQLLRQNRAERHWANRKYKTTKEKQEGKTNEEAS